MMIICGLVGPKPMVKTGGDGQQVNIPAPPYFFNGATERSMPGGLLDFRSGRKECRKANPPAGVMPDSKRYENFGSQGPRNLAKRASQKNL